MKKTVYVALLIALILIGAAGCADQYDVGYQVGDTREYVVDGQTCMGYSVVIDLGTFDLSQDQKEFNRQIKYVYDQVIEDDGYDRHTVWIYEDKTQIGEMEFTVAMVDDGHEWQSGWLITPNEDFLFRRVRAASQQLRVVPVCYIVRLYRNNGSQFINNNATV